MKLPAMIAAAIPLAAGLSDAATIDFSGITTGDPDFSTTVEGITFTLSNLMDSVSAPEAFSDVLVNDGFWFGRRDVSDFDLAFFTLTVSETVTLDNYGELNSSVGGGIMFSITGSGVNSTGNILGAAGTSRTPNGGPLVLEANQAYTFAVESPANNTAALFGSMTITQVPEPSGAFLFALSSMALGLKRRRR